MLKPVKMKFAFVAVGLCAAVAGSQGRTFAAGAESLATIAQKSDILVVGEVMRIDRGVEVAAGRGGVGGAGGVQKRATLKVLRGLRSADGAAVEFEQLTVQYTAAKASTPASPHYPVLSVGQVAVFPLKFVANDAWRFINEEDAAMIMPAAAQTVAFDAPDARILLFRELAGAFVYGDFATMIRAGRYLDDLAADKESPVEPVFAIVAHEIGDTALREDPRWIQMAVAAYAGIAPTGTRLRELGEGDLPTGKGLRFSAKCVRKAGSFQRDQRLLLTLTNHQNDPGLEPMIAAALASSFADDASMLAMERESLKEGKLGAILLADRLVTSARHALAPFAAAAGRAALTPEARSGEPASAETALATLRAAVSLVLRCGNDEDFASLQEPMARASRTDPAAYQAFLAVAGSRDNVAPARVVEICRQYINDPSVWVALDVTGGGTPWRACDQAMVVLGRVTKEDFGFKAEASVEARDAAIDRAMEWLRGRP